MFSIPTEIIAISVTEESLGRPLVAILPIALYLSIGILVRWFEGGPEKRFARVVLWPWLGNGGRRGKFGWH